MTAKELPTQLQQYIHLSRYARWIEAENRRETWAETVGRYVEFFRDRFPDTYPAERIQKSIASLRTMPSMRALMTAGPALDKDEIAGYNCSAIAIDHIRAFDEVLYVLMCFHPDTLVVTRAGTKRIADVEIGDEVMSVDETTGESAWKSVTRCVETESKDRPKVLVTLDNGRTIKCTADHKWLTSNRGWVEAAELATTDDLVSPDWSIYKITNTINGKVYIGQTTKNVDARFKEHLYVATTQPSDWHFAKALRKHDQSLWRVETIDFAFTQDEAYRKERIHITEHNSVVAGYNSTEGGEGAVGYRWTDEQRRRASENAYVRTDAHREQQREVLAAAQEKIVRTRQTDAYRGAQRARNIGARNPMFGKQLSKERLEQLRTQNKGAGNPFFGMKHSEASKQKIRDTKAAKKEMPA